jgi:hypothetical protein
MARVKTPGRLFAVIKEGEHARGGKRIVCGQLRQIHLRYEGKIASSPLRPRNVRRKVRQATELGRPNGNTFVWAWGTPHANAFSGEASQFFRNRAKASIV